MPLIVILTVTSFKDAFEDWRRTVLDNELNNAPVYRLMDFENVNTMDDKVGIWRRFKKANTRLVIATYRAMKKKKTTNGGDEEAEEPEKDNEES